MWSLLQLENHHMFLLLYLFIRAFLHHFLSWPFVSGVNTVLFYLIQLLSVAFSRTEFLLLTLYAHWLWFLQFLILDFIFWIDQIIKKTTFSIWSYFWQIYLSFWSFTSFSYNTIKEYHWLTRSWHLPQQWLLKAFVKPSGLMIQLNVVTW